MAGRARAKRLQMLLTRFPQIAQMRVLDLGGFLPYWDTAPFRPAHVTLVNLEPAEVSEPWADSRVADACDLPADLRSGYDLAFSNSVLEHVGGHVRRQQVAASIRSAAPHHWVQTPYRYFPIEPHFVFPGQQFLPVNMQARIAAGWRPSHIRAEGAADAVEAALSIELVGVTELQHYFPTSTILKERFAGLTKSIIAVALSALSGRYGRFGRPAHPLGPRRPHPPSG